MDENPWDVRTAIGSSTTLIREALNKENPDNPTGTINFVATNSFAVHLHHHQWHQVLRSDGGIDNDEIFAEGKITFFKEELPRLRIGINSKAGVWLKRTDLIEHRQMEDAIKRFVWDLLLRLESWGESFSNDFGHSPGTNCPNCYWQLNGMGFPQGLFTFIVGFTTDGPISTREGVVGIFIVECQKCFEKYWFHARSGHIEACKRVGRWPKD
jgi:hypothetical protein